MLERLTSWATENWVVVILVAFVLVCFGTHAFLNVNVEAYPDPAPAIVEVIAQYPGASAEEVERQVTIPLEVSLAGIPGLKYSRSKSLFGLSHIRNQFDYGVDFFRARTEVLNRLHGVPLPPSVMPTLAPTSPTGEIYRYVISSPKAGRDSVYTLNDLKGLQDWVLEKEFRRIPRIADVVSFGGTVKRYEVQPDPDQLRRYGISLEQLEQGIAENNANVSGDYILQRNTVQAVRGLGLIGLGRDPLLEITPNDNARIAAQRLRAAESRRLNEISEIVLSATDNVPVRVRDVMDGGQLSPGESSKPTGVIVGHHTRFGRVSMCRPLLDDQGRERVDARGNRVWYELPDTVQGIVLLRKGEPSLPALVDVKAKIAELNGGNSRLLPQVRLETFYDRTWLINLTTETVRENVVVGILLVTAVLFIFLNNVRSALIVAINIPLALLFAFSVLYVRGKSANLLSLGAVDFGIIVDSSVVLVETIYRHISTNVHSELDLNHRIRLAAGEVQRSLIFATTIMVFALLPLFTMQGPEGQIFGPMADAYAFALGGALILAVTLSPTLCSIFFRNLGPARDNFLVRNLKRFYLWQLEWVLAHRWLTLAGCACVLVTTGLALPYLGREFMPELEEGNVYIRGTFPVNVSLDDVGEKAQTAIKILRKHPEVRAALSQAGRPDDGTDPTGFYNCEFFLPLKSHEDWPRTAQETSWRRWIWGDKRSRTKNELIDAMESELARSIPGVDWNFSQNIRDNVMETLSGVKGENSVKIIGPDLDRLERIATQVKRTLSQVAGIEQVGIFSIKGQTNLEFPIDRAKCGMWNVSVDNVQDALQTAVGGREFTELVEGERKFDVTLRWPERLRSNVDRILDIPVEVVKNRVTVGLGDTDNASGPGGSSLRLPSIVGSSLVDVYSVEGVPRRRLGDLVTPRNSEGDPDPVNGSFIRSGASTIYREQGKRLIAVKFSVRNRDLASAVAEAQKKLQPLIPAGYTSEWSGEFQEMQEAVARLGWAVLIAMGLIVVLLYLALRSVIDALVVLSNVVVMCVGGIWALLLTGTNFNISAGVGFVSILGVGVMNGLLLVSRFNQLRGNGVPLEQALREGVETRIRPLTMTALTAIFGMLPAAVSTRIGAQTQAPLAIVVIGGMLMTALLNNFIAVLYSFYGDREPVEGAGMAH